jgi:hypothetical protein
MVSRITIGTPLSQKVIVTTTPKDRISINNQGGGGGGVQTLRQLKDVDATNLVDGETIVYEAEQDKFVVETLPKLDGGTF